MHFHHSITMWAIALIIYANIVSPSFLYSATKESTLDRLSVPFQSQSHAEGIRALLSATARLWMLKLLSERGMFKGPNKRCGSNGI
ncbi:uncharacterized protein EV420DRAFT_1169797 [Desarmillaria tabescens]|uniref:Uncharacterized protein n=1 Tax=Armillaria tabescens TaxID=1929756 RepID=A0AA39JCU9_ARMTA|nr:uncharacterized protein EV420DRAFT_1169797 [Desarmillaria tabescens]KAK0439692.1 hypothetical protein EV420DRAFT_1169797 [Desarmillaria tabescens]